MNTRCRSLLLAFMGAMLALGPAMSASPSVPAELAALTWVEGTWVGHQGNVAAGGADFRMDCRWAPTNRALLMDLTMIRGTDRQPYMTAIYYWHPGTKAIAMWQVLSTGTVNEGQIQSISEKGLIQELRATDPDGRTRLLQTQFERDGADAFQFTSSSRASAAEAWTKNASLRFERQR